MPVQHARSALGFRTIAQMARHVLATALFMLSVCRRASEYVGHAIRCRGSLSFRHPRPVQYAFWKRHEERACFGAGPTRESFVYYHAPLACCRWSFCHDRRLPGILPANRYTSRSFILGASECGCAQAAAIGHLQF